MTRAEFAKGSAMFLIMIVAGFVSTTYVDRHYAANDAVKSPEASMPNTSACVGENGSWKNWPWPNVPALSPKC